MMWDQMDVRYGMSKPVKQRFIHYVLAWGVVAVIGGHFMEWHAFWTFQFPEDNGQLFGDLAGIAGLGLAVYGFVLLFRLRRDVRLFRLTARKDLFIGDRTTKNQVDKAVHRINTRIEMYSIISRPHDLDVFEQLDWKTWSYYVKKLGSKQEVEARIFCLERLKEKLMTGRPLQPGQKLFLNELLHSEEDRKLVERIRRDLDRATRKTRKRA